MIILGWTSLALLIIGAGLIAFGFFDMERQVVADGKMGGAILIMFGAVPAGLGVVLGIVWLAVT